MTVKLLRAYQGHLAGAIVSLPAQLETALIAQQIAQADSVANVAAGNMSSNALAGTAAIAAGANNVVITNSQITPASKVVAYVNQAAADGTLLRIDRVVPGNGQVTLYGNANATAKTLVDWAIIAQPGMTLG
jgi:hypothetical protein